VIGDGILKTGYKNIIHHTTTGPVLYDVGSWRH